MSFDWADRAVFITGASSGIGRSLAIELGRRGAQVALAARRAEALREIASEIERAGGRALSLPVDVREAVAVRDAADRARERFGRIDLLIANAGISMVTRAQALRSEEVAEVMGINFLGAVHSVTAVLPEMVARRSGQLVAISSLAAYRGLPRRGAYCASKAALSALFESLRVDLRGTGVGVTIIHPGFIKTPLTAGRREPMPFLMELDEATRKIIRAIEARRKSYAFPWQLASIVRFGLILPPALYDRIVMRN